MKYQKLIKDVRLELSEANKADKEGKDNIARACLVLATKLLYDWVKEK